MIPPCQQATESSMNLINFTNSIKLNSISGIVISNKRWRLIFSRSKINARLWLILPCFAAEIRSGFGTRTPEMNRKERYYTVDHRGKETIRPRISYSTKTEYLKDENSVPPPPGENERWNRCNGWLIPCKNRVKRRQILQFEFLPRTPR